MKAAICISGQFREFNGSLSESIENLGDFEKDIYISTWDKLGVTTALDRLIRQRFIDYLLDNKKDLFFLQKEYPFIYNQLFFKNKKFDIKDFFKNDCVKNLKIEISPDNLFEKFSFNDVEYPKNLVQSNPREVYNLLMFYKIWDAFNLIKEPENYDIIIRVRPDFNLKKNIAIEKIYQNTDTLYLRDTFDSNHVDDQFAFGSPRVMESYSNLWLELDNIWKEKNNLVSGYLLNYYLRQKKINIDKVNFPYTLPTTYVENSKLLELVNIESLSNPNNLNLKKLRNELLSEMVFNNEKKYSTNDFFELPYEIPDLVMAHIYINNNNLILASNYAKKAMIKDNKSFLALKVLWKIEIQREEYVSAIDVLNLALTKNEKDWIILRDMAYCYFKLNDVTQAYKYILKANDYSENETILKLRKKIENFI